MSNQDEAINRRLAAEQHLAQCRADLRLAQERARTARGLLSEAIRIFQTEGTRQVTTPEQLKRDYLASEQQRRQAGIKLPGRRSTPGPSYWDRVRSCGVGGDANDFVRKQHRHGGNKRLS